MSLHNHETRKLDLVHTYFSELAVLLRIDIDDWWPNTVREFLTVHRDTLLDKECMETMVKSEPFNSIAEELEKFIRKYRIIAYHCTKEPKEGFYQEHGLRILDRKTHQREFLLQYRRHFSLEEIELMERDWDVYFPGAQDTGRNGLLWFCLTPDQVVGSGTKSFFEFFGGEAIYMPLTHHLGIAAKLRTIGNPVVVETSVDPNELQTFSAYPFAVNALSLFHRRVNAKAYVHDREGYLTRNVLPEEILRVTPMNSFFRL